MTAALLAGAIAFNTRALHLNLAGITEEEALGQPRGGNCINWLLGHIVLHRNLMLAELGQPAVWDDDAQRRYERGSEPIRAAGDDVTPLTELRREFDRAHTLIETALREADPEVLTLVGERSSTAQRLQFLALHEAYHVGQIALMRRIAGHTGAIA
jgi:hypothetical protein